MSPFRINSLQHPSNFSYSISSIDFPKRHLSYPFYGNFTFPFIYSSLLGLSISPPLPRSIKIPTIKNKNFLETNYQYLVSLGTPELFLPLLNFRRFSLPFPYKSFPCFVVPDCLDLTTLGHHRGSSGDNILYYRLRSVKFKKTLFYYKTLHQRQIFIFILFYGLIKGH